MKFIKYNNDKCDDCYKCLRVCPTKAIVITDNRREIIDDLCIKCGLCQQSCTRDALEIQNDRVKIQKQIDLGKKIAVSLAPSYAGVLKFDNYKKIVSSIKALGIDYVEETSIGAEIVAKAYEDEIIKGERKNIITSCCPSANYLIEKYYPSLIPNILDIVSPMICHGRMLKEKYGKDTYVVFIGPCLAKKSEAEEVDGAIDAILTFQELMEWFDDENIVIDEMNLEDFDEMGSKRGAAFPLGGSLYKEDLFSRCNNKYKYIRADGIETCSDILKTLENDKLENYCIEINICNGSCINGPDLPNNDFTFYESEYNLTKYLEVFDLEKEINIDDKVNIKRSFTNKHKIYKTPNEKEINKILANIGKYTRHDELNCGACGYDTCREKAISIYRGLSDPNMCLPYLRNKAESLQMVVFDNTPNLLCILDKNLRIIDFNPSFSELFGENEMNLKNIPVCAFLREKYFKELLNGHKNIRKKKIYLEEYDKTFYMNATYIEENDAIVLILNDITATENSKKEIRNMKEQTLKACNEVINKQMRVAQEVASLLGETTAETKVNLNRLRNIVLSEDEG